MTSSDVKRLAEAYTVFADNMARMIPNAAVLADEHDDNNGRLTVVAHGFNSNERRISLFQLEDIGIIPGTLTDEHDDGPSAYTAMPTPHDTDNEESEKERRREMMAAAFERWAAGDFSDDPNIMEDGTLRQLPESPAQATGRTGEHQTGINDECIDVCMPLYGKRVQSRPQLLEELGSGQRHQDLISNNHGFMTSPTRNKVP